MSTGDASGSTVEQRALRTSLWAGIGFAVVSAVWGLLANSEVILLDAVFTPLYLLLTSSSLIVSRIVAKGPSSMFPFGRNALAPLVVIAQAIILVGALAYAILEAVRVILAGGSEVAGISLLGGGTRFAPAAPYVDPAMVIIAGVGFALIPVNLFRTSLRDLQTARPEPELAAQVETVVENARTAEGLPEPILRVGRLGAILDVALAFVLPPGTGDIACEDRSAARCATDSVNCPTACGSPSSSATTPSCSRPRHDRDQPV